MSASGVIAETVESIFFIDEVMELRTNFENSNTYEIIDCIKKNTKVSRNLYTFSRTILSP